MTPAPPTPAAKREGRRERASVLRRLMGVEHRLGTYGHEDMEVRIEDVEERLSAVEARVDLLAAYDQADALLE